MVNSSKKENEQAVDAEVRIGSLLPKTRRRTGGSQPTYLGQGSLLSQLVIGQVEVNPTPQHHQQLAALR